jgi:hypothetical protein
MITKTTHFIIIETTLTFVWSLDTQLDCESRELDLEKSHL